MAKLYCKKKKMYGIPLSCSLPLTVICGRRQLASYAYMSRNAIDTIWRHRYGYVLSQPRANSCKLCIQSVISLGFPYYYKWAGPEALKGQSIVSDNSPEGCRSPRSRKQLISHIFFLTPTGWGTALATEVQHILGFMNIRTDLELCLVSPRAKPKMVRKHVAGKRHP